MEVGDKQEKTKTNKKKRLSKDITEATPEEIVDAIFQFGFNRRILRVY